MDWNLNPGDVTRLRVFFDANPCLVSVELENGITFPRWILGEMDANGGPQWVADWLNEAYGRVTA